jgi:hypothetical protein
MEGCDETVPLDALPGAGGRMSERHSTRKVREVLRLKHERKLSDRQIALAIGIARSTVGEYLARAEADGLTWVIAETLGDADVEARLFRQLGQNEPTTRAPIDFSWVHMELRRAGCQFPAVPPHAAAQRRTIPRGCALHNKGVFASRSSWRKRVGGGAPGRAAPGRLSSDHGIITSTGVHHSLCACPRTFANRTHTRSPLAPVSVMDLPVPIRVSQVLSPMGSGLH